MKITDWTRIWMGRTERTETERTRLTMGWDRTGTGQRRSSVRCGSVLRSRSRPPFAASRSPSKRLTGHRLLDHYRGRAATGLRLPCHGRSRFLFDGAVAAPNVEAPVSEATRVGRARLQLDQAANVATNTDGEQHVQAAPAARAANSKCLGIFADTARGTEAAVTKATATVAVVHDWLVHNVLRGQSLLHDDRCGDGLHSGRLRILRLLLGGLLTVILGLGLSHCSALDLSS